MAFFRCIGGGGNTVTIDGQEYDDDLTLLSSSVTDFSLPVMNVGFQNDSCAVVLNNEIHIFGGINAENKHYKYSNGVWEKLNDLPGILVNGCAVVMKGEIYILGLSYDSGVTCNKVCKYIDYMDTWVAVGAASITISGSAAVVLNNEIHILGGENYNVHYKFDGKTWSYVGLLPYNFRNGCAVVLNNEIHILGSDGLDESTSPMSFHYRYGGEWHKVGTLPYKFYNGCAVVLNNEIHILGGDGNVTSMSNSNSRMQHYVRRWVDDSGISGGYVWKSSGYLPWEAHRNCCVVMHDEIYMMSSNDFIRFSILNAKVFHKE